MLLEDRTLTVSFEKLGVIAGTSREMNITINMQLMERDPQLFEEVFGHELAHSLCHVIYTKVMGHGNEWQKAIKALEVNGSEFHDYNLDEFRLPNQKIYLYKCRCRQHKISQESHENSQGQNRICHLCNSKAVLMG
jgi:SprT protein